MPIKLRTLIAVAGLGMSLTAASAMALDSTGEGRRLFLQFNCYGCHGGRAGGGMGPNFRDDRPTADDVKNAVEEGLPGGMPRFENLEDRDIKNLVSYIKSLRTPAEPTFTHWWEAVPSQ
jgi:mono/diheme cytochrome c family protein